MRLLVSLFLLCSLSPAFADDLTLNDLPAVLQKLRGCAESRGVFTNSTICRVPSDHLWVSVASDGSLTLFQQRSYGDTTYARGASVPALLRDFASKLNAEQAGNKAMLQAIGQYLPTQ